MVDWRARRQAQDETDTDLIDLEPITDSVNQFADSAVLLFDDPGGDKKDLYPRGQRVELEYSTDGGSTYTRRFAGAVQDVTERSTGAADKLQVDLVGYSFYIRVRTVFEDYTSKSLSTILQDLVTQYSPVNYKTANVTFANDATVDMSFDGERLDSAIARVASRSGDEDFGVNRDFEFFFKEQETDRSPSNITDGDWIGYDLPERGREAVNRVELFYGASGSESRVVVEDRAAQRDLSNRLGGSGNVVISTEKTYPRISTEDEAESKAREILTDNSQILTGTVTTFGRFDMEAGDVFRLQIGDKNIDTDFRVAQIEYFWRRDETRVTVAENTGDVESLLVQLADDVRRIDSRDADPDADFTQFLELTSGVTASPDPGFSTTTLDDDVFVAGFSLSFAGFSSPDVPGFRQTTKDNNAVVVRTYADDVLVGGLGGSVQTTAGFANQRAGFGRFGDETGFPVQTSAVTTGFLNQLRDVWQGGSASTISHVALGTGTDDALSTDQSLTSEISRAAVAEQSQPATDEMAFTGRFEPSDDDGIITGRSISEFGFFDDPSAGVMFISGASETFTITRRTVVDIRVVVTIANDGDLFGAITDTGQERLVDLFLGDTGHEPTDMAFGTGTTSATPSDTGLGSKVTETGVSFADRSRGRSDVTARLGTSDANGNDLSELGEENSANELLSRIVFEAIGKTSNFALDANHIFAARNA